MSKEHINLPKTVFSMKANLPNKEPNLIKYWDQIKLYESLRESTKGKEKFILHDGPPYANGNIHMGTPLNKILVDTTNDHLEFYVEVSSAAVQQLRIQDGAIVPITDNDIDLGTSSLEFKDLYVDGTAYVDAINYNGTAISATAAELNILDGVTSTATELNIIDGDTTATSTTVADADRVVLNDGGTMKQVAVTDLSAYFDDEITAMPNLTSVGTLTTLTVDNIIINGTNIGHTSDTDALALSLIHI